MDMYDEKINLLKELVNAAQKEYLIASACHEAWRPTAFDTALQSRMENTYAGNTFATIRSALRRETVLALMRLWDNNRRAVSINRIAAILRDQNVVEALVLDRQTDWERPTKWNEENGKVLRERISDIIFLITLYETGGEHHGTMLHLRNLRNEHYAHKQLASTLSGAGPLDSDDQAVERFYTIMARLLNMLKEAVLDVDYQPEQSMAIFKRHADLFWDGVRRETTEGHLAYRTPK